MDIATCLLQQHLSVSVIIPARNEAPNLQYVLPRIPTYIDEVILIDGHSVDNTVAEAQRLLPDIRIVEQTGTGKGAAIKMGLAIAKGDIVVLLDADGSTDPLEIPHFIHALLAGNDFAKGSRFLKDGGSRDITWVRRIGNRGLILLVNILFKAHFSDLCYGYNAFWRRYWAGLEIDSDGFEIETIINIRMHQAGLKIVEVPSFEHPRICGLSKLHPIRDGLRILKLILRELMKKRGKSLTSPMQPQALSEEAVS